MNENQIRRIQKNRHVADIMLSINSNSIFKNLSPRDKNKLAKLIYKAELVEIYVRERDLFKINNSFKEMIDNIMLQMDEDFKKSDSDDEEDED